MFTYQDPKAAAIFASGCAIGSILPDIDSPKAMISKACQPISILVNHYFGHRGFTHSPFVVAILIAITQLYVENSLADFLYITMCGLVAGYSMHLLQDSFTRDGIPIFYPFSKKKFSFCRAKSGSFWNYPVTFLIVTCWILICLYGWDFPQIVANNIHSALAYGINSLRLISIYHN